MILRNLDFKLVDSINFKREILEEIEFEPLCTEKDAEDALNELYDLAERSLTNEINSNKSFFKKNDIEITYHSRKNLWQKIKEYICQFLDEDSNATDFIDKILEFLATVIPGGIVIKFIVRKIVKYLLNLGYRKLCPAL